MESLPRPAPADPLPIAGKWLTEAATSVPKNPWAMALATVSADGHPSVRYVLLKDLSPTEGFIVFFTHYSSRKAVELEARGAGAAVLYWPTVGRQLRFEGRIERSPDAESDAYFSSRPRASQLNAWASEQSDPIKSPDAMTGKLEVHRARFANEARIPRPRGWGGYRLYLDTIEFWVEGPDRFHERLRFERSPDGTWSSLWLQP